MRSKQDVLCLPAHGAPGRCKAPETGTKDETEIPGPHGSEVAEASPGQKHRKELQELTLSMARGG